MPRNRGVLDKMRGEATLNGMLSDRETGSQVAYLTEAEPRAAGWRLPCTPELSFYV